MRNVRSILALLLCACLLFALCACGNAGTDKESNDSKNEITTPAPADSETDHLPAVTFTVKVVDEEGNGVSGAWIKVCKGTENCYTSMSDEKGNAPFIETNIPEVTAEHELSVLTVPDGYSYTGEEVVHLTAGITEYTVTLTKAAE